jgi:Plant transposon protein
MDMLWNDDEELDAIITVMESDSDDDDSDVVAEVIIRNPPVVWGSGSRLGKAPNIDRQRVFYSRLLYDDFWGESPTYNATYFKRFFKLPIGLFNKIVTKVTAHDTYFEQKRDAAGRWGLTPLQKICSSVRQLTSGVSSAEHDDKYRMAASTGMDAMKRFCNAIIAVYSEDALRPPNAADLNRLLDEGNEAGFPGCIGSIDCMHWHWKNCPSSWRGMFQGRSGIPTVILEAIADSKTRFWHFNFGSPGSVNDVNVLDKSPLFENAVRGEAPRVNFTVNGNPYEYAYWLGDGIYPAYACFVKTIPNPTTRMQKMFASAQEAKRKDIERAFGILQARFHILTSGCRLWDRFAMSSVIRTCVILHNLIIDYEIKHNVDSTYIEDSMYVPKHPCTLIPRQRNQTGEIRGRMITEMKCSDVHRQLQHDLMSERWERWYNENNDDENNDDDNEADDIAE